MNGCVTPIIVIKGGHTHNWNQKTAKLWSQDCRIEIEFEINFITNEKTEEKTIIEIILNRPVLYYIYDYRIYLM